MRTSGREAKQFSYVCDAESGAKELLVLSCPPLEFMVDFTVQQLDLRL